MHRPYHGEAPWSSERLLLLCDFMRCRALLLGCFWAVVPGLAIAQSADLAVARGAELERSFDFAGAEAAYREAIAVEPESRASRRARVRLGWLDERRIDGAYRELVLLERARRSQGPVDLAAFEGEIAGWPPGLVRAEARLFLGRAAIRAGDDALAERTLALLEGDGSAPRTIANAAALARAEVAAGEGDEARAIEIVHSAGIGGSAEASDLVRARNEHLAVVSASIAAVVAMLLLLVLARPLRAPTLVDLRGALMAALYAIAIPGLVATLYSADALDSFLWFAALGFPFLVIARLVRKERARPLAALGLAVGVISAAVLALALAGGLGSFLP
jgi:hypothetical protein